MCYKMSCIRPKQGFRVVSRLNTASEHKWAIVLLCEVLKIENALEIPLKHSLDILLKSLLTQT